ncbi:MAG TPA: hypothetical protein VLF18_20365 [Tahibacter sp.]|uniref:hypothetical protein n=1 Tax=Tahibacter sp. TaxID=2056211 RepID=UPI002C23E079|nr:hypothetical protein [Tahibacter sp.]HSX62547.1 hypothetical protein [Tahibacter sp.]
MRLPAAIPAAGFAAAALFAAAATAASLSSAVPGVRGIVSSKSGLFETSVSRLDLDSIRSTEVAPDGPLAASSASAQSRLVGNALVVDLPGPEHSAVPTIVRPLGVLWRWSPPAGSDLRPPTVRVRLLDPLGQPDEIANRARPDTKIRTRLVTYRPSLVNDADGPVWTGEAELHIEAGDLAEPGTYQGRIEITFENS